MSDSILQRLGITWDADRDEPYIVLPPPYQLIRLVTILEKKGGSVQELTI